VPKSEVSRIVIHCSCSGSYLRQRYFVTASYDGHIRAFNYSQTLVTDAPAHSAPITSICLVPTTEMETDTESILVASASHDLTAQLTHISLSPNEPRIPKALASLHLHSAPVSSVTSNASGSHLLTASWDGLIGLWDTVIPKTDEVPLDPTFSGDRKKRRRLADDSEKPKRKAPLTVLKSHTARVSKVIFGNENNSGVGRKAYSCGFDSTVRTWDVENGVCTHTIVRSLFSLY
jgi:ribosome biogenesis protein